MAHWKHCHDAYKTAFGLLLLIACTCVVACNGFMGGRSSLRHHMPTHPYRSVGALKTTSSAIMNSNLVQDLDLIPLMEQVAAHTVTLRGRRALLQLVSTISPSPTKNSLRRPPSLSSRQRRAQLVEAPMGRTPLVLDMPRSASEARQGYEWTEQATLVLQPPSNDLALPWPPFYNQDDGPFDTKHVTDTDDDEWLDYPVLEWTLEDVLKAEKVMERLMQLYTWGQNETVATWAPLLANKASTIPVSTLQDIVSEIAHAVELVRVKTATDPSGRSSFLFRLSDTTFPVLRLLRAREADLQAKLKKRNSSKTLQDQLDALHEEIEEKEKSIQRGLCMAIAKGRPDIDAGLRVMAELDVCFAKAAFGIRHKGIIPKVSSDGTIDVEGFVHPLVAATDGSSSRAVPVDLQLATGDDTDSPARALVISGPNGGGKTLAMKSFGVASQMVKLGLPIPVASMGMPVVGFFDEVITAVGDRQSLETGQSTFMAQLSSYVSILDRLGAQDQNEKASLSLVLLDELGSGTEAEGGGAIAQAILEHMLETSGCRVVATTHSSRLKTTSFEDSRFTCATVLLEETFAGHREPSYRLEYGLIGESFALEAASRVQPQLPESILQRASELCRSSEDGSSRDKSYLVALTASLEKQKAIAISAREQAESFVDDMIQCRAAMIQLAKQYDRQLGYWEARVVDCFDQLRSDEKDSLELLGETLQEIRVAQKNVQSQAEKLRQRGLRLLPNDHTLTDGESVVIVDGKWDGAEGIVVAETAENTISKGTKIRVSVTVNPLEPNQLVEVERHQLAIWDYDCVFDDLEQDYGEGTSRQESRRRLSGILSSLTTKDPAVTQSTGTTSAAYTSARQRKAAKKRKRK